MRLQNNAKLQLEHVQMLLSNVPGLLSNVQVLEGQVSTVVETNAQLQQEQQAQRDELSFLSDELISLRQTQSGENLINKWVTLLHAYILVLCSLHQTHNMWNYNSDLCGQ